MIEPLIFCYIEYGCKLLGVSIWGGNGQNFDISIIYLIAFFIAKQYRYFRQEHLTTVS